MATFYQMAKGVANPFPAATGRAFHNRFRMAEIQLSFSLPGLWATATV